MYITIDFQSEVPIYQQVKENIIIGIATGQISEGESLPSIRQIAAELGVNLHTINKAYNQLKGEGYISVDRRKGTTVLPIPSEVSDENRDLTGDALMLTLSTARCRGFDRDEILNLVEKTLDHIEGNKENE